MNKNLLVRLRRRLVRRVRRLFPAGRRRTVRSGPGGRPLPVVPAYAAPAGGAYRVPGHDAPLQRARQRNQEMRDQLRRHPGARSGPPAGIGRRAARAAARATSGTVWLLTLLAALILLGGILIMSEGARTAIGFESIGQKIDRLIGHANAVVADAGDSARGRAISLSSDVGHAAKQIDDRRVAAFDAGAARVDAATGAVRERVDAAGTRLNDAAITASIKTDLLKDPFLSALRVDVSTTQGEVTLTGDTNSDVSRERAARMAAAVAGVRRVNNQIAVLDGSATARR